MFLRNLPLITCIASQIAMIRALPMDSRNVIWRPAISLGMNVAIVLRTRSAAVTNMVDNNLGCSSLTFIICHGGGVEANPQVAISLAYRLVMLETNNQCNKLWRLQGNNQI